MKRFNLLVVAILFGAPSAGRAQATAVNWDSLTAETIRALSSYLQINTTNPPGNELAAARWLKAILDREGIEAQILDTAELGANRANLYARLRGNGSKKAIALVHHMDVVPATPASWSVDPFSGLIKDGYIWGRGAIDMKSNGIAQLMAMIALKRSGATLNRDIVFIGNADEELGSLGGIIFGQKHPDLLRDVEFLMTEGADNVLDSTGKVVYFGVGVAEKRTFWQRLTVNGVPSHGSRPTPQNPVPKLVTALYRISQWQTPLHVTAGVDRYFRDIARTYQEPQRGWLSNVRVALANPRARSWILSDVMWNAILRNTISLTGLTGSSKTNVIPGVATAEIDIRLLPDQDTTEFREDLKRVIGDTAVHLTHLGNTKPPLESPIDTDLFHAIERAAHDREPSAFVTTPMETAATDRPTYRKLGIVTYGFSPFRIPRAEIQRGMHGNDERLSIENVGYGLRFYYDILRYVQ
jgi:acetylornithine deacetylase/succinyl-diaminopimelate desuccinylase-like protein